MTHHEKTNLINRISMAVLLYAMLMFLVVSNKQREKNVLSFLFDIVCPKMEVQAGTIDANGHTVATDLSGKSYSLLTDDKILYIFRTTDNVAVEDSYTYTKNGKSYSGEIKSCDFEHNALYAGEGNPVKVVFLDDIQPVNMSFSNARNLISVDGMKEHLDTSKVKNWGGYL